MKKLTLAFAGLSLMVSLLGCCCHGPAQCCGYGGGACPPGGACSPAGPTIYPQGAYYNGVEPTQAAAVTVQPASQVASLPPVYNPVYRTTLLDPLSTF